MKQKVIIPFLICILCFSINLFSQNQADNNTFNDDSIEKILKENSYTSMDLPEYRKAEMIIKKLMEETSLTENEISALLTGMVQDSTPVDMQILIKIYNMPVFIDTGNPVTDQENYNKAKETWIKENPDKYQELNKKKDDK